MKGKELDREVEKILMDMLVDGYHVSPISQKSVFERLRSRGIIKSKATLTKRMPLIKEYLVKQQAEVKGVLGESLVGSNSQTRANLIASNARLKDELRESKQQLIVNTNVILDIVKTIKTQTNILNIERILSPKLIRELREND
ncbi:hypothetical protein PTRA_a1906 [Pseudoalteromonas translucida KMM 520]|uniref:Uncharacterized protein n=1 Tax=Pseudoalteromonas translucida KMM 520 TaxID=1315283 RepID=A0A0U2WXM0_9GAMM|nr:hypothetical protein [Pseudoalteromonas translucida]ALS33048.1 hypothetical protein PTRA_a1906 [Pseudoalteromonas translucida KMM 520]